MKWFRTHKAEYDILVRVTKFMADGCPGHLFLLGDVERIRLEEKTGCKFALTKINCQEVTIRNCSYIIYTYTFHIYEH